MQAQAKSPLAIASALAFSLAALAVRYWAFGLITTLVFTSGFLGGFLLWLALPTRAVWGDIRLIYWITLALFLAHRVEENRMQFFARLAEITGEPTPQIISAPVIILLVLSVGAWLAIPVLFKRESAFGNYLAWTFFAAMGITELAHLLVFPFIDGRPLGYFPGMASVIVLAPAAWFGMVRLVRGRSETSGRTP